MSNATHAFSIWKLEDHIITIDFVALFKCQKLILKYQHIYLDINAFKRSIFRNYKIIDKFNATFHYFFQSSFLV